MWVEQYPDQGCRLSLVLLILISPPPPFLFFSRLSEVTLRSSRNMAAPTAGLQVHKTPGGENLGRGWLKSCVRVTFGVKKDENAPDRGAVCAFMPFLRVGSLICLRLGGQNALCSAEVPPLRRALTSRSRQGEGKLMAGHLARREAESKQERWPNLT